MTPASPSPRRLTLLGCLLAAAALALSACGGGGAATAESADPPQPRQEPPGSAAAKPCPGQLDAFVESLDTLRSQLAVGLSYEQYAARMKGLDARYETIPVGRLTLGCLATSGSSAEKAFNKYVDATNAWGECLADAACTTTTIEPVLQRKWRRASRFLAAAQ